MIETKEYFDESQWPHYRKLIIKKINQYYNKFILNKHGKDVQTAIDECLEAHEKYYIKFNWSLYHKLWLLLLFAIPLIIPAYFVIKKLYSMIKKKGQLYEDFLSKDKKRIEGISKLINTINFTDIINICFSEIKYENKGPIPPNFLEILKKYYPKYKNDWIVNNELQNVDASSWGVFDKRIVVLNVAKKTFEMIYPVNSQIPKPSYKQTHHPMMLILRAEDLKFRSCFDATPDFLKSVHKKWKHIALENNTFNNQYIIIRNNEVEFRIFYTAAVQEYFIKKLSKYTQGYMLPYYYWWNKKGPFVYSRYEMSTPFYDFDKKQFNFINDIEFKLQEILNSCTKIILKIILERFLSLNCASVLPILMTQNQKKIINELDKDMQPSLVISKGDDIYAQGVLNIIWNQKIIRNSDDIMYVTKTLKKECLSNGLIITKVLVDANYYSSFSVYQQACESRKSNDNLDYRTTKLSFYLYYLQYKTFAIFDNENNDVGELLNIIKDYGLEKRIKIKDDHIVFVGKDDHSYEKFKELVIIIDNYFKNNTKIID